MNGRNIYEVLKIYEGQPVKIFTDDERAHCGIALNAFDGAVRIVDKCGRLELIDFSHIVAIVEPQMRLMRCCDDHCDCKRHDHDKDKDKDESSCGR